MNNKNKLLVFLPDGIGLRNFVFGNFHKTAKKHNYYITYWNNTQYPINEKLGLDEIKIKKAKNHFFPNNRTNVHMIPTAGVVEEEHK